MESSNNQERIIKVKISRYYIFLAVIIILTIIPFSLYFYQTKFSPTSSINFKELQGEICFRISGNTSSLTTDLIGPDQLKYDQKSKIHNLLIHCFDANTSKESNYWVAVSCGNKNCSQFIYR